MCFKAYVSRGTTIDGTTKTTSGLEESTLNQLQHTRTPLLSESHLTTESRIWMLETREFRQ